MDALLDLFRDKEAIGMFMVLAVLVMLVLHR